MSLNISKGNMYDFVTHTWNTVKGECFHDCSYCYMKKWGKLKPVRFDKKELKTDLGKGNFIFVGSSCDMFAENIPDEWIRETLLHCSDFDNKYLFQTKNPERFMNYQDENTGIIGKSVICTTIESNRDYPEIMGESPLIEDRVIAMHNISYSMDTYVTIEPIMDFDLDSLSVLIKHCNPVQVNIGADSGNNKLPEPSKDKILSLIKELEKFTKVKLKKNLNRILK
jgi:DNA repair photolyase